VICLDRNGEGEDGLPFSYLIQTVHGQPAINKVPISYLIHSKLSILDNDFEDYGGDDAGEVAHVGR
jgi:hypothetical protein